ncbi:MAG: F0F1 ATP synthase subunit B [Candidatus Dormibacteraeota bacterium]|nr:F0F1 ATP synthase subunit B [Candidatus Dormibacteraeota bacterium]
MLLADAGLLDINGTFIAEVIAFILMILVLGRYAYPRIMKAATEREDKIEAGLRAAEESQRRLAQVQDDVAKLLEQAREQAREISARAHRDAVVEAQEVLVKARTDAEALLVRAEAEIGSERDRAIQELRAQVSALVVDAAGRVIGEALDEKAHKRLIDEALTKVGDGKAPAGRDS